MNENNLVSVIIPAYNAEKTILRTLESVFNQTYRSIEVIIVDDGSNDNTLNLLKEIKKTKQNSKISIKIISKKNGGVSSARNVGLRHATGNFIAFLDSDDEWYNNKLSVQVNCMLNRKINFLSSAFQGIYFKDKSDGELIQIKFKNLIYKNYFQPSTVILTRNVFDQIGFFNEDQKYAEEGNYFLRIAHKFECYFMNTKLINFGDGKRGFGVSGLSSNLVEMEKGELRNLRYIFKNNQITFPVYLFASVFSILKFFRRCIIVKINK